MRVRKEENVEEKVGERRGTRLCVFYGGYYWVRKGDGKVWVPVDAWLLVRGDFQPRIDEFI